jgi:hypothetical protein
MLKQQIQQPSSQTQQHQLLPNLDMISPVNQSSVTYFDDVDHSLSIINFLIFYFEIIDKRRDVHEFDYFVKY